MTILNSPDWEDIPDQGKIVALLGMMQIMEGDMDNVGIAEECGFMKHSEESGNDHTRIIDYYECTADEIKDFASRLTSITNAEIERLNGLLAMQAEALKEVRSKPYSFARPFFEQVDKALSASSDTVAAYKREVQAEALENAAIEFDEGDPAPRPAWYVQRLMQMVSELRAKGE